MAGGGIQGIGGAMNRAFLQQSGLLGSPSPSYIAPSQLTTESAGYKPGYTGHSNISPMPTMRDNFAQRVSYAPLPRTSPLAQQMMDRSNAVNPYGQGLQSIYSMFNAPRQLAPMPVYRNPALNYRPNMQSAQDALRRVAPSVEEQRRLQAIEDARRAAEEAAAAEAASLQSYYDYGGGG